MKTIDERALLNLEYETDFLGNDLSRNMVIRAYIKGATEQKAIDDERIAELEKEKSLLILEVLDEFIRNMEE